ncbi:MAG: HD domain-containing protein [Actinomycetota bacterium]
MAVDVDALVAPPTLVAALALEVAREWCSPDLLNHSLRSWVWASTLGDARGLSYDPELLFVASLLHDIGVTEEFDSHSVPFETAGGAVGWVFASGAGWPPERRTRVLEVIERHMWVEVDPATDVEGHLLEVATSLDVAGVGADQWSEDLLRAVTNALPRGDFSESFAASIHAQAARKPESTAARLDRSGRIRYGSLSWDDVLNRGETHDG